MAQLSDLPREDYIPPRFVAEAFAKASRKGMQPGIRRVGVGKRSYGRQILDRYYPEEGLHVFQRPPRVHEEPTPLTYICPKCKHRNLIPEGKTIGCRPCAARRRKAYRERQGDAGRAQDRERKRRARAAAREADGQRTDG